MAAYFRGGLLIDSTVGATAISNCVSKYRRATFVLWPTLSKITKQENPEKYKKSFVTRKNISSGAYTKHCYYFKHFA